MRFGTLTFRNGRRRKSDRMNAATLPARVRRTPAELIGVHRLPVRETTSSSPTGSARLHRGPGGDGHPGRLGMGVSGAGSRSHAGATVAPRVQRRQSNTRMPSPTDRLLTGLRNGPSKDRNLEHPRLLNSPAPRHERAFGKPRTMTVTEEPLAASTGGVDRGTSTPCRRP